MNEKIMKQEATYDWLKDEVHCLYAENKELKTRIDKAIEYIEKYKSGFKNYNLSDMELNYLYLLDILKGSDKDE